MSVANTSPVNITLKRTVTFSTTDQNTGNPVAEGFTVYGPVAPGVSAVFLSNKAVVPLTNSGGNGSPFLKFWFPDPSSGNTMYVTYAVANSSMADGYYDYQTGVPSAYLTALRSWINTNPATGAQYTNNVATIRSRTLRFNVYGSSTNQIANAKTFYVTFTGTFGSGVVVLNSNNTNVNSNFTQIG